MRRSIASYALLFYLSDSPTSSTLLGRKMEVPVDANGGLLGGFEENFSGTHHQQCSHLTICKPHSEFTAAQSCNSFRDKEEVAQLAKSYVF